MIYRYNHYQESADYLRSRLGDFSPEVLLVLGSGLGYLGDTVENPVFVDYGDAVAICVVSKSDIGTFFFNSFSKSF